MRNVRPILALGCLCSVGLNLWLLSRGATDSAPDAGAGSSKPAVHGPTGARHKPTVQRVLPVHQTRDASGITGLSDDELDRRIAAAEKDVELLSPLEVRYEHRPRSLDDEKRVRPLLDKIFHVASGAAQPYDLECHAGICMLVVPETKPPFENWSDTLQDAPNSLLFESKTFSGDAVYLELADPLKTAGWEAQYALLSRFWFSGTIKHCKQANATPAGTADFVVSLDRQTGRFRVNVSGTLASEACGRCVLSVLQGMIAEVPAAPRGAYVEDWQFRVGVP
jgi:hypothetical protein